MKRTIFLPVVSALFFIALSLFCGCKPDAVAIDSVNIKQPSVKLSLGSTYQLSAIVSPSDATQDLEWFSSRPAVATVNASGVVTAVAVGSCDITASAGEKSDVCHVIVVDGDPSNPDNPGTTDDPSDHDDPHTASRAFDHNGASYAVFSVAADRKVHFSKGNLQFTTTGSHAVATGGTEVGTWRFAEHQYDCIGDDNANISSTYTGWIDLFGWGTSGWNSGARAYQPWSTSANATDYQPGNSEYTNLTGSYANADWGVYNAISNGGNYPGMWRTLTEGEWKYLLFNRDGQISLYNGYPLSFRKAVVNNVNGLVIFPDGYQHPEGVTPICDLNTYGSYHAFVLTLGEWEIMENLGCIFLPAAEFRGGTEVIHYMEEPEGRYWSSTHISEGYVRYLFHYDGSMGVCNEVRCFGLSVRLVRDVKDSKGKK